MKKINDMIAYKDGEYWMKEIFCNSTGCSAYGMRKSYPLTSRLPRCRYCGSIMSQKWKSIGNTIDHSEYFTKKTNRHMKQGRND